MNIEIRSLNERLRESQRAFIVRRLLFSLGRFGSRVRRVMVRLEDLNGPRGGLDKRCQIEATMERGRPLVVDVQDIEMEPAVSRAADRMARRVRDEIRVRQDARRRSPSAATAGGGPAEIL